MTTIELGCGFGNIPDCTEEILAGKCRKAGYLDPNAMGEYVAAVFNYEKKNLKLVFGSLGFGCFDGRWWALGGPDAKVAKDFHKRFHTWAEDDQGNVWDVVPSEWHELAARNRVMILVGGPGELVPVEGRSRESLAEDGLHYIPAPEETQRVLESIAERAFEPVLKKLGCRK